VLAQVRGNNLTKQVISLIQSVTHKRGLLRIRVICYHIGH
jgi:hypothetical protein